MTRSTRPDWTRRSTIQGLASFALAAPAVLPRPLVADAEFDLESAPPLRSNSRLSGIKYGCAGAAPDVQPDRVLLEKFAVEADIFVPEGALKWIATEPQPGKFDFADGDSIAAFAARHGMLLHGHTLVWYAAIPDWVSRLATADDARAALERHIVTEVQRYRGKAWAWDVVNEAIEPKDGLANGYRNSIWFRLLGIDYVDLAFRLARAADPAVPLSLNEYGLEYTTAECQRRREATLGLLQQLRDRNTPIDCFGLQSHLEADKTFDRAALTDFLRRVVKLGYRLMITEMDVNDVNIPGSPAERDAAVARHTDEYLDIVFSVARPLSLATWGLSDRYTWMHLYYKRADGSPLRPLPLDVDYKRKRLWKTLSDYLAA